MTLITETVTINSKNYKHIYSDAGYYVKRNDNKLFMDVLEPTSSTYTYTETTQLATQQLLSRMMARMSTLEGLPHIVETYSNGTDWYRVYSDKWLEQGGTTSRGTITFKKPFKDTNYSITVNGLGISSNTATTNVNWTSNTYNITSKSKGSFLFSTSSHEIPNSCSWSAFGFCE